ncbi:hypothetical protein MTYM_01197 [Methylococcales bacterium]|nr:hypothetical protein MTYM_01197 [Methylococcales bacterium]
MKHSYILSIILVWVCYDHGPIIHNRCAITMALYWCNNLCWFIPKVCDVKLMYLDYYISIGVAMTMALLYHHLEHVQLQ